MRIARAWLMHSRTVLLVVLVISCMGGFVVSQATHLSRLAFAAKDNVGLISSLALLEVPRGLKGAAVLVSRSTDGGHTWDLPVTVAMRPRSGLRPAEWQEAGASPRHHPTGDDLGRGPRHHPCPPRRRPHRLGNEALSVAEQKGHSSRGPVRHG